MPSWDTSGNATTPTDFLGTTNNQSLVIKTAGNEQVRIDLNGNVGIGTNDPGHPLHLAPGKVLRIEGGVNANDTVDYFSFGGNGSFGIDAPGVPDGRFLVQNSGNVGIGTAQPSARLSVVAVGAGITSVSGIVPANAANVPAGLLALSDANNGVIGQSGSEVGVWGISDSSNGVLGSSDTNVGVFGFGGGSNGVWGVSGSASASGVYGENYNDNTPTGGWGGYGVAGRAGTGDNTIGVLGDQTGTGWAGYFTQKVYIAGHQYNARSGFQIDHPLEPRTKYLNHSSIEAPEMKNMYDGVIVLDSQGSAWVELPAWFEALNRDFRYQLTPIGSYRPVYVAQEIAANQFQVAGGYPGQRVSWQVTGIRRDAWAERNRIEVEEHKQAAEQGKFLYPVEAGHPEEMGIPYSRTRVLERGAAYRARIEQAGRSRARDEQ